MCNLIKILLQGKETHSKVELVKIDCIACFGDAYIIFDCVGPSKLNLGSFE